MNLETFDLSDFMSNYANCDQIQLQSSTREVESCLRNILQIHEVTIQHCGLNAEKPKAMQRLLKSVKVDILNVSGNDLGPEGMIEVAKLVGTCDVDVLVVRACCLQIIHLEKFMENAPNANLAKLDMSWNIIPENMIQHITTLVQICGIEILALQDCKLEEVHLRRFLQNAPGKIEELDLSENTLGIEGMSYVARLVQICKVQRLFIVACDLGSLHLKTFFLNLENAQVDVLDFRDNRIGKSGVEELVKAYDAGRVMTPIYTNYESLKTPDKQADIEKSDPWTSTKEFFKEVKDLLVEPDKSKRATWKNFCQFVEDYELTFVPRNKSHSSTVQPETVEVQESLVETDATASVQNMVVYRSRRESFEAHYDNDRMYRIDLHKEKGRVLIINNEFLGHGPGERRGSLVDVNNQTQLWNALGFDVTIYQGQTAEEMTEVCAQFAEECNNVSVVVIIIMTHGEVEDNVEFLYGEDNERVTNDSIISCFSSTNSPHLRGIPKVLMFQACRGERADYGGFYQEESYEDAMPRGEPVPEKADMLIVYPSEYGYPAFRSAIDGSWLMNAITNVFMRRAHNTSVAAMLTEVNGIVARKVNGDGRVQMSNQLTYLTKELFLFPGWPDA